MRSRVGFMQGRLSPMVDGKIQSFPAQHWREEFFLADQINVRLMEWTLDQQGLYDNPLLTSDGQQEILSLCQQHNVGIPSLTGDCFMQAPFWKAVGDGRAALQRDFLAVLHASAKVDVAMIVVPLVDNGAFDDIDQEDVLVAFLESQAPLLEDLNMQVLFESDLSPLELARFIGRLDSDRFGVNYDIGNSAALGYNPVEEFRAYGKRIVNAHVKDRPLNETTVPLGDGDADFATVFSELSRVGYEGNFILQTARAEDGDHAGAISRYCDMIYRWQEKHAT